MNDKPLGRVGETPQEAQESTMDGAGLIAAERKRQIEAEGWTSEHDDAYMNAELYNAAIAYIWAGERAESGLVASVPYYWPWDAQWWKPSSESIRNLVKAGALIAAEIDRQQRIQKRLKPVVDLSAEFPEKVTPR